MRAAISFFLALSSVAGVAVADVGVAVARAEVGATPAACRPAAECCKVCRKGKACGDSCISATKTCHRPAGCACDAENVCR